MRLIKFRVWIKKDKRMLYKMFNPYNFTMFPERFELMQFTGLKDKNGKDIYEGDIVLNEDSSKIGIIEFAYFGFCLYNNKKEIINGGLTGKLKILGNKFENPELLK